MRMNECDLTKRVYESTIEGRGVRGRPPAKWINRVEEYTKEYKGSTDSNSPVGPNEAVRASTHHNYTMSQRASI